MKQPPNSSSGRAFLVSTVLHARKEGVQMRTLD
jgi:hypothetical protein